jgi:hypothetical protein
VLLNPERGGAGVAYAGHAIFVEVTNVEHLDVI